jgi:hypothetical protein
VTPAPGSRPAREPTKSSCPQSGPGQLCSSLEHRRAGRPAQVVVTLAQMGTPSQHREAVWIECWGKSYPMCGPCWQATRQVAQARRPALVITGTASQAGDAPGQVI